MARCYSAGMAQHHPVPRILLLTDARNDAGLERAIARLPRGSGVVFRHYHLPGGQRLARFHRLRRLCQARRIVLLLAGTAREARRFGAAGAYAAPSHLGPRRAGLRLATAHSLRELRLAVQAGADGVLLSLVFATRSHPGGAVLGPVRFLLLAAQSLVPVIALGGMTARRARPLGVPRWAAIDGLSAGAVR